MFKIKTINLCLQDIFNLQFQIINKMYHLKNEHLSSINRYNNIKLHL